MRVFSLGIIFALLLNEIIDISAGKQDLSEGLNCCSIKGPKCKQRLDNRCEKNGPCKYFIGRYDAKVDDTYYAYDSWKAAEDATGCNIGIKEKGKCRIMCVKKDEDAGSGWM